MAKNSEFVQGLIDDGLLASDADDEVKEALDDLDYVAQQALRVALDEVKSFIDPRLGFVFI